MIKRIECFPIIGTRLHRWVSCQYIGPKLHPSKKFKIDSQFSEKRKKESDYSLKRKSPAIDLSVNLNGKYTVDFLWHSVPKGKGIDIGAFEFQKK